MSEDQVIVAAELITAANDATMFNPVINATEANLARPADLKVSGPTWATPAAGSSSNVTARTGAEVLITPMPAAHPITDTDDPRIAQRNEVLDRLEADELTPRRSSNDEGGSTT